MARDLEDKLSQAYRTTVILAAAMIASVFVYAGLVELLPRLAPSSAVAAEAYYLLLVSLLSFIVVFPRHDRWREALNEMPMRS